MVNCLLLFFNFISNNYWMPSQSYFVYKHFHLKQLSLSFWNLFLLKLFFNNWFFLLLLFRWEEQLNSCAPLERVFQLSHLIGWNSLRRRIVLLVSKLTSIERNLTFSNFTLFLILRFKKKKIIWNWMINSLWFIFIIILFEFRTQQIYSDGQDSWEAVQI